MASYFFKLTMETQSGKRKAEIGLPTSSRQQKRARMHLFRDSYTAKWPYIAPSECDDYAFCKVCDDSFSIAHGSGNDVSHGIEQTVKTNSTVRQFCCNFTQTFGCNSSDVLVQVYSDGSDPWCY